MLIPAVVTLAMLGAVAAVFAVQCVRGRQRQSSKALSIAVDEASRAALRKRLLAKHNQFHSLSVELRESRHQLTVADVMTSQVSSISENATRTEVEDLLNRNRTRHLIVCDSSGGARGIISDRDLYQRRGRFAKQIMTQEPLTVAPDLPIGIALGTIIHKRISCLPVCKNDILCGVLTTTDLLMALECLAGVYEEATLVTPAPSEELQPVG